MKRICEYIGIDFDPGMIHYGGEGKSEGLGDPLGVAQHDRPTTASLDKWVRELSHDAQKRRFMEGIVAQLDPNDLRTLGYPPEDLWKPLEKAGLGNAPPASPKLNRYRLQRKAIVALREHARKGGVFQRALKKVRLACDVLLRE